MYTLDYIKSLHIDLEKWNNGPVHIRKNIIEN